MASVAAAFVGVRPSVVLGQPYGLATRPAIGPFLNDQLPRTGPALASDWTAVVAFTNLTFSFPLGVTPMPGTGQLVVWEREGLVWSFTNHPASATRKLILNLTNQCQGWFECGLLGLAFHPGFATNRYVFVYYNWVPPGTVRGGPDNPPPFLNINNRNRLSRFTLDADGVAIPGSELVLIDQQRHSLVTNGGGLFFNPANGFLYLAFGIDASETIETDQRLDLGLFSGAIRIDVDRRGGSVSHASARQPREGTTANYYIPNDNPFVGVSNVLEEFFVLGLRNPHRMTLDEPTGRIFIGDVGGDLAEEVNVVEPGESGLNFQWSVVEGNNGDLNPPYFGVNRRPKLNYRHSDGVGGCIIGGYVYRGSEFATELGGKYIFGDNLSRFIWMLNEETVPATKTLLTVVPRGPGPIAGNDYTGISSFGVDENGELYICQLSTIGSQLYKLRRQSVVSGPDVPPRLSLTGAFTNLATLAPATGLMAYDVASPLWSDGAFKTRWMAIPSNTRIGFTPTNEWSFPSGSVFVKHFELATNDSRPDLRRRLETRLLVRDTNGYVYGATYKWRSDLSDADLLTNSVTEELRITTASGTRTQSWYYPSRQDCQACHTAPAGGVLGVKTRQSNHDFFYSSSGVSDNQLRTWNHIGLFNVTLNEGAIPSYPHLVAVTNTAASLEERARSYLDANCAHCHRPGGVRALWDGRYDTPLAQQGLINGLLQNTLNIPGARVVVSGDLPRSVLHLRMERLGQNQMPPLARNTIDEPALDTLEAWIRELGTWTLHPESLSAGGFHLWFDAAPGDTFVIEASANLQTWTPLSTNQPVAGRVDYIQPAPLSAQRFYRTRVLR